MVFSLFCTIATLRELCLKIAPYQHFCVIWKYYFLLKIISVVMKYKRATQLAQNKTKKENECKCICSLDVIHFQKNSWFQPLTTLRWCLSASFFKAVCKLISLSLMAFPPVLFMSRRLPSGPALADAGPNPRPRRGAPLSSDFVTSSCSVNRVTIVVERIYTLQH